MRQAGSARWAQGAGALVGRQKQEAWVTEESGRGPPWGNWDQSQRTQDFKMSFPKMEETSVGSRFLRKMQELLFGH